MLKNLFFVTRNKSSIFLLVLALIVGGVGAQATGLLNTASGGYLVCVNSKTKVVSHPGTSSCPKGSKKLVLGAQGAAGAIGLTGAAGMSGKDGTDGKDGKTLWNGTADPVSTWGAPGDMFINSVTKTLFGPKNLDGTWPAGVSMVGPKGDQGSTGLTGAQGPGGGSGPAGAAGPAGANGTNATIAITELFVCDGPDAGTVADEKCKIGMTSPGGGLIFFVDYQDEYSGFNYLEVSPSSCEKADEVLGRGFGLSFSVFNEETGEQPEKFDEVATASLMNYSGRLVGSGSRNTQALLNAMTTPSKAIAAYYADSLSCGTKTDWFLGSLGEYLLLEKNLPGLLFKDSTQAGQSNSTKNFWTSSISFTPDNLIQKAYGISVDQKGLLFDEANVSNSKRVRAIRSF